MLELLGDREGDAAPHHTRQQLGERLSVRMVIAVCVCVCVCVCLRKRGGGERE